MLFDSNGSSPFAISQTFNISNATVDGQGHQIATSSISASPALSTLSTLSASESSTTVTTSSISRKFTTLRTPTATSTSGSTSSKGNSGVGVGVGIGVGVGSLLLIGAALLVYFGYWRRRRQQGNKYSPAQAAPTVSEHGYGGYGGYDVTLKVAPDQQSPPPSELPGQVLSELPGQRDRPSELSG